MGKFSVPFTIDDVYGGWAEAEGILSFDGSNFEMQFQTSDSLVGVLKSDIKKVTFPMEDVGDIQFKKKFFSRSITIRFNDMEAAAALPNAKSGEIVLAVKRKHTMMALDLIAQAQLDLAESRLRRAKDDGESNLKS